MHFSNSLCIMLWETDVRAFWTPESFSLTGSEAKERCTRAQVKEAAAAPTRLHERYGLPTPSLLYAAPPKGNGRLLSWTQEAQVKTDYLAQRLAILKGPRSIPANSHLAPRGILPYCTRICSPSNPDISMSASRFPCSSNSPRSLPCPSRHFTSPSISCHGCRTLLPCTTMTCQEPVKILSHPSAPDGVSAILRDCCSYDSEGFGGGL